MSKIEMTGKKGRHSLLRGMIIYALVFLVLTAVGLYVFWDCIESYEESRPQNSMDTYMAQLTEEHICNCAADVIGQIDQNLQSENACLQVMKDSVSGGITYAKKSSASSDSEMVYMLRSGSQVIGSVTLSAAQVDRYGFPRWQITEEEFDMSFLIGSKDSVTVPDTYAVYYNGVLLDDSYIIQQGIQYAALDDFYGDYDLPTMVTYSAGPILGDARMEVKDTAGNSVVIDENTDYDSFLSNCTQEEITKLATFCDTFVKRYVAFTGSANKSSQYNYSNLIEYVVIDSDLHNRMRMALDGLSWAQSRGDTVVSITANQYINIGNGKYICDVTYEVDTTGTEGVVRTSTNAKFVAVETTYGLKAEMLVIY